MSYLSDRMMEDMKLHGFSPRTQEGYISAVRKLARYWRKPPDQISEEELRKYFLWMVNEQKAARSTCIVAITGIKLFFQKTLHKEWPTLKLLKPRRETKLPVVLSVEEVRSILQLVRMERYRMPDRDLFLRIAIVGGNTSASGRYRWRSSPVAGAKGERE